MLKRMRLAAPLALATLAGPLAGSEVVRAHEEGVLTLASSRAAAGGTFGVTGAQFDSVTSYALVLKGALTEYKVGSVEPDSEGRFTLELSIPADVRPGSYRLVALAEDGHEAGSADLTVDPPAAQADVESGTASSGEAVATPTTPIPRADELVIERRWSGFEWFVIGAALIGSLAVGASLYRNKREG